MGGAEACHARVHMSHQGLVEGGCSGVAKACGVDRRTIIGLHGRRFCDGRGSEWGKAAWVPAGLAADAEDGGLRPDEAPGRRQGERRQGRGQQHGAARLGSEGALEGPEPARTRAQSACATPSTTIVDYSGTCVPNYANSSLPGGGGPSVTFGGPRHRRRCDRHRLTPAAPSPASRSRAAAPGTPPRPERRPFGGAGTGATGTAVVTGGVTSITVNEWRQRLHGRPDHLHAGGWQGSGAAATATIVGGVITAITVTAPGSGYTRPRPSRSAPAAPVPPRPRPAPLTAST